MAISDTQKVDYLWKKIGYSATKTDTSSIKEGFNEATPSPLQLRADKIMTDASSISGTIPGANTTVVSVYTTSAPVQCTNDATSSTNRTWQTGLTDWISPEFGSTYQAKVYVHTTGFPSNAASAGTQIFAAGSGNNDEWFFDYQSGVLHFIGTNLPNGISFSGKSVYVSGARYTGGFGVGTSFSNITVGDFSFTGNTMSTTSNIVLSPVNGYIFASNSIISNVANPLNNNDVVTLDYLNSALSGVSNSMTSYDSSIIITDAAASNNAYITTTIDGTITSNATVNTTEFFTTVNIGNISIGNQTISTVGNIRLETLGNGVVQIIGTDAMWLPSGDNSGRPAVAEVGYFRYNTGLQSIEYYNGNVWISPGQAVISSDIITPDGASNVYSLSTTTTDSGVLVSINGTLQQPATAYSIAGDQITFIETPLTTDIIEVRHISVGAVSVASLAYGSTDVILDSSNVNVTGNFLPSANITYDLGSDSLRWRDIYLSGNTINLGGMTLKNDAGIFKAMMGNIASKLQAEDPVDNADVVTLGYLNSQLSSINSSLITLDDSSISVIDDGVDAGNIVVAVDGSNIATFGNNAIIVERDLIVTNEVLAGNLSGVNVTGLLLTPDQYNVTGIGTLTSGTWSANTIAVNKGGTGATTSAEALNNLLPSGEQTGYVLKTSGPGTYYWSGESGGGGATVGQQLTTTRQANTATSGQTIFTLVSGITYTPGTGQLRVYINGVRQFPSEYTETASNVYTLTSGVSTGDIVFAEIDNFSTFNNYANLTYASNIGNITAVGLTVQGAIDNLENNKAPLTNPVFTGVVTTTGNATIGGALTVSGNLYVNGNVTYINANNINLNDSLIYLADDNPSDSLDIGFVSAFTSNGRYQHTGFVRDATDGVWKLFANVVAEPTTTIDFTNATYANLQVGNIAGTITTASQPNITTVGTLGSLAVTGNVTVSGNVKLSAAGWSVRETGTKLYFAYNGVNKMSLDTGGNLVVTGDVTAFGTIT
jgi:hypothetical protein